MEKLADYSCDELIAVGKTGRVYRAHHDRSSGAVAIKVLHLPPFRDRLTLSRVNVTRCRPIRGAITTSEVGTTDDEETFIVMELFPSETLARRLVSHGARSSDEVTSILLSLSSTVAEAHAGGLIHGRLGCDCVLEGAPGDLRITDYALPSPEEFGLEYVNPKGDDTKWRDDVVRLAHIATELLLGKQLSRKAFTSLSYPADRYLTALGLLDSHPLYQALHGLVTQRVASAAEFHALLLGLGSTTPHMAPLTASASPPPEQSVGDASSPPTEGEQASAVDGPASPVQVYRLNIDSIPEQKPFKLDTPEREFQLPIRRSNGGYPRPVDRSLAYSLQILFRGFAVTLTILFTLGMIVSMILFVDRSFKPLPQYQATDAAPLAESSSMTPTTERAAPAFPADAPTLLSDDEPQLPAQ